MDKLIQVIRKIASFPVIGNVILIIISFVPLLLAFQLKVSPGLTYIIGGLCMAAFFYFLKAKNVINVLAPGRIPMWIIGVLVALFGVYVMFSDKVA